jgi:NAD(P)H-hydrate epimerase
MKLLTPQQMKAIDKTATELLGIPGIVLMENAAMQVVVKASSFLKGKNGANITVLAGPGNNGGDAFAVSRHLLAMGHSVSVFSMCQIGDFAGDARTNALILKNMGLDIPVLSDNSSLERLKLSCRQSDLVIDGLLGTGLNRDVEGIWENVIEVINKYSDVILSIDIASGVVGLTGKIRGSCVHADATVTFFLPKIGMVQYPGAASMGELTVADIGIPYALAEDLDTPVLMEKEDIRDLLPVRRPDGHKGTFGKILIFAGSEGMTGAAYLCALSAYRTGSGLIKLAVPKSIGGTMSMLIPEAVQAQIPEKDGHSCLQDKILLKRLVEDADVVLFGPGLSCNEDTGGILKALVECCEKPMVIDADGLNLLAAEPSLLENLRCEAVITPHPAEMGRLTGLGTDEVQKDRIGIAKKFADEYGLTVVLKGAGTVIATNDGRIAINPTGNSGMATAGSGDVLAGMIASLLGQGLPTYEAAAAGVYLHGLAGNFAAHDKGTASLIASDIIANIPQAFKEIANG